MSCSATAGTAPRTRELKQNKPCHRSAAYFGHGDHQNLPKVKGAEMTITSRGLSEKVEAYGNALFQMDRRDEDG